MHRADLKRLDIVIYEDDDLTRALLHEWLSEAGYRVRAGSSAGADSRADLVIAGLYMPKQSGSRCIRNIKALRPGTPIIAISGQFRPGLTASGATADTLGVQQVIAKPLIRAHLLDAVRAIIGGN